MRSGWTRPGTASRLPLSLGIQNEWMTSLLVIRNSTCDLGRDHQLAAGDERIGDLHAAAVLHRVLVLPPPLLAGDVDDALRVAGLGQREHRADRGDADTDQDQRRDDREGDLERRLAVRLLGHLLAAIAVPDDDEDDDREDDDADDAGNDEHRQLQVLDLPGVLALLAETCPAARCERNRRAEPPQRRPGRWPIAVSQIARYSLTGRLRSSLRGP